MDATQAEADPQPVPQIVQIFRQNRRAPKDIYRTERRGNPAPGQRVFPARLKVIRGYP
jgi:hypothetical protein